MKDKFQVIFCIVNAGFSDEAMAAAREAGAKGGTIIHARGTANINAEKIFGISVQPEKEIVMILVKDDIRDEVMRALYRGVGLKTACHGIAFCMPVDDVVGLSAHLPQVQGEVTQEAQPAEQAANAPAEQ